MRKLTNIFNPPKAGALLPLGALALSLFANLGGIAPAAGLPTLSATKCKADISADKIDAAKYFGAILTQVRKDWTAKAKIYSVRYEDRGAKTFDKLCSLRTNSDWTVIFFSSITNVTETVYLQNYKLSATGVPLILYSVKWPVGGSISYTGATIADMKKHKGAKFATNEMPVLEATMKIAPDNLFVGWKLSMSQVVQKLLSSVRKEKVTGYGYSVTIESKSLKSKSPWVQLWWNNGTTKNGQAFIVEPITLQSYTTKY